MRVVIETKSDELTPEQRLAAHELDRHVSVTAGPGAGKTKVLVERYLQILQTRDVRVDQIVAITFTNRAANEMRERLRKEIDELLWSSHASERIRWMRHKRTLDGAIITTIHGFCARLLREFPVEADLDPQFKSLDAHESAMLEEAVAEEALTEFINAQRQEIAELAAVVGRPRLARGVIDIYRAMRGQGLSIEQVAANTDSTHKTIDEHVAALECLNAAIRRFIQCRDLPPLAEKKRRQAELGWPALEEMLSSASGSTSVASYCGAVEEFRDLARPNAHGKLGDMVEELDELLCAKNFKGRIPQYFIDVHAQRYTAEVIKLVSRVEHLLDDEKARLGALDFDDLQLRALRLLDRHPQVLSRISGRYRFLLVDEFQDTNGLQRDLMAKLALRSTVDFHPGKLPEEQNKGLKSTLPNLFIVGDSKQSIYGFRGADVDVFREMSAGIESRNGLPVKLDRSFRSQHPLIRFFNLLFERVFERDSRIPADELNQLGYVAHEPIVAARVDQDLPPLVELLIDLRPDKIQDKESTSSQSDEGQPASTAGIVDRASQETPRERDAEQLAARVTAIVGSESISRGDEGRRTIRHRDIAMLFRAMTEAHIYESALRRWGIPYLTVDGKGFYAREEITDFIQLLRFLDNKTDDVALAAVLRSPIFGLSDNALLALRCAPLEAGIDGLGELRGIRPLIDAIRNHQSIDLIDASERAALDRARGLLDDFIGRARRLRLSELLRYAVEESEYCTVAAANFDGAQKLANIEKLYTLAERFERSGSHMIRDFVHFVRDFEEAGGRESEGQIDEDADAVRLMSVHQSKGLEFPVVIIPDLHRLPDNRREFWALDRQRGLTLKVPDGRGKLVAGHTYSDFTERQKRREEFESMRLLYVGATRAQDRLILSGAAKELARVRNSWLGWIATALELGNEPQTGAIRFGDDVEARITVNLRDSSNGFADRGVASVASNLDEPASVQFPLLAAIEPQRGVGVPRFSVTQLLNYRRCPRQYYFDRVLWTPSEGQVAVWNYADAPEPPANLTATLKGAVIHRFCERYAEGADIEAVLGESFDHVLRQREAELSERLIELDRVKALQDLLPLARNYVSSAVRMRIEAARSAAAQHSALSTLHSLGVLSEQRFKLRRRLGLLTGTIDKLLVYPSRSGLGLSAEIIDFKTNRFHVGRDAAVEATPGQLAFGFASDSAAAPSAIESEMDAAARDYQLQMQSYALAAHELIPDLKRLRVTLHFLHPDIEVSLPDAMLERDAAARAIDESMAALVSSTVPESFLPRPAQHCRSCSFLDLCAAGRQWLAESTHAEP